MLKDNLINYKFKNYKKTPLAKRKKRIKVLAIVGVILMISGLIGSIICYL